MMKSRVLFGMMALAAVVLAGQDAVTLERKYREGEEDRYTVVIDANTQMGDATIQFNTTQKVHEVFDNGDAELETLVSGMRVTFNGEEVPMDGQAMPPMRTRVSKNGMPAAAASGMGRGMNTQFLAFASLIPDKPLKVGEVQTFTYVDQANAGRKATGSAKLEAVEDGVARIATTADITDEQNTMKLSMTSWINVSDSKMARAEGVLSNVSMGPLQVPAVQFKLERVR